MPNLLPPDPPARGRGTGPRRRDGGGDSALSNGPTGWRPTARRAVCLRLAADPGAPEARSLTLIAPEGSALAARFCPRWGPHERPARDASGPRRWTEAAAAPLAGDASARSYLRLARPNGATAVLMQAPVMTEAERESLAAVTRVNGHLAALGLSAPATLAEDMANGLLLQEDFGDVTLARLLASGAREARAAYAAAAQVLDRLATARLPDWAAQPDTQEQVAMLAPTLDALPADPSLAELPAYMAEALTRHAAGPPVLALRDYHADNLTWLPARDGPARIGLLDVQDAVALPLGYDLASLLDDPRRDVPEGIRTTLTHPVRRHPWPYRRASDRAARHAVSPAQPPHPRHIPPPRDHGAANRVMPPSCRAPGG